ncbi:MAG: septal ring lytic transglycosylase RlpA family protein [Castellaniella sp.]|uniref:septal ring lytic transglycosylase RlpA family protein n=1 Tax=Castellaniella sp. TaxID=1955812 RepID=UPI001217270C|nr:septal ring lytic transglycosylase RlpA family protein [Castellaniella sp.]TAN28214.1 MAG: septal ring lytic transglycosylase RlpA family protein [Castellaniella sp.]
MSRPLHRLTLGLVCLALAVLAGCASRGRYGSDGMGDHIPANIAAIPDAVPRIEHPVPANFRPYEVFGVRYVPLAENQSYRREGVASWYGRKFHGEKTANGETYDMYAMTAAHPLLPVPSYARVTRVSTGRSIIVRINDRGPFHPGRIIDLSYVAAAKLGLVGRGSGEVIVQAITNADILAGNYRNPPPVMVASRAPSAPTPLPAPAPAPALAPPTAPAPLPVPTMPAAASPPSVSTASAAQAAAIMGQSESANGGVYLQFGAFASALNAQAFSQRINAQINGGQTAVTYQSSLYKVRMGPYASRDAAAQAAAVLARTADINPVVATD